MLKSDEFNSRIQNRHGRAPRAAIYVRTTTKGSRRQLKKELKCRAYCDERGWTVVEDLVISELASPSTLNREGLLKLLVSAAARRFDILVIYEFGELSKKSDQSDYIIDKLAESDISLAIVNDLTMEQMLERIEKLPDHIKKDVKSKIANLALTSEYRQN